MNTSTLKTVWGFLLSMIGKYTPLKFGGNALENIYNYLPINERVCTSGQPTEKQFNLIRQAGYTTVINLLPAGSENALEGEADLLESLGVRYIHIPVDFRGPKPEDFQLFVASMQAAADGKVWVHCAANARVSVFMHRYRCEVLGEDREAADKDLANIWQPYGVWKRFLAGDQP